MACSGLNKIGNIFSRATGLLRTSARKYDDRPLWYDVYRVFPPKYEPRFDREVEGPTDVQPIFYGEDLVRADFLKRYGLNPGGDVRNLRKHGEEDAGHKCVMMYNVVQKSNFNWAQHMIVRGYQHKYSPRIYRVLECLFPDKSQAELRERVLLHPHWRSAQTSNIEEVYEYFCGQNHVKNKNDIFNALPILFYPLEKVKESVNITVKSGEANWNDPWFFNMVLYFLEKPHHFTGDGIWSKTPDCTTISDNNRKSEEGISICTYVEDDDSDNYTYLMEMEVAEELYTENIQVDEFADVDPELLIEYIQD